MAETWNWVDYQGLKLQWKFEMEVSRYVENDMDLQGYMNIWVSVQKIIKNWDESILIFGKSDCFATESICAFEY